MKKKGIGTKIALLFSGRKIDEECIDALEETLIEGDIGAKAAMQIVEEVERLSGKERVFERSELGALIRRILRDYIKSEELHIDTKQNTILLILGVNGVGKTTSIAKLAAYFRKQYDAESILAAADTFRAAAIDQLQEHGRRLDLRVVHQRPGADPGAVIYDAVESAKSRGVPIVIADTAGRMHTKANLVKELQKIDKIITSKLGEGNYQKLMVIDATTGQNGLRQAEMFHDAVGIDGMVLAKYDSASKGGIAVSISHELGIPFMFMGTGEKYEDIEVFDTDRYLDILLGEL